MNHTLLKYENLKFSHCIKRADIKFKQYASADQDKMEVKTEKRRTNCLRICRVHQSDKPAKQFAQSQTILLMIKTILFNSAQFKN